MRKLLKRILALVMVVIMAIGVVSAPIIKSGYNLYRQAVQEKPIEEKVIEIMKSENYTEYENISPIFIHTLLKSEDKRFFEHFAVDPIALARALIVNITKGKYTQGGSTITQQLAKNMYFSFEKRMERKIAELFVAFELERMYTKEEILSMYCTLAYFGNNCYGVKRASEYYYSVLPSELNQQQADELVATLKAPSVHNPSTM